MPSQILDQVPVDGQYSDLCLHRGGPAKDSLFGVSPVKMPICNFMTKMYFAFQRCEITRKCEKGIKVTFMSFSLANISSKLPPNLSHHLAHSKGLFQIVVCSNIEIECRFPVLLSIFFFLFIAHRLLYFYCP